MPIRFRCTFCNRLLGIASRKAGTETTCPHCGYSITVPMPEEENGKTERLDLEDVDQLLGNHATERITEPATQVLQAPPEPPKAVPPKPAPKAAAPKAKPAEPTAPKPPIDPNDPPLFENDMDELFGKSVLPVAEEGPKPSRAAGQDAIDLDEPPRSLVISPQKATLLMCGVVVLLALAFAAGYFVAR